MLDEGARVVITGRDEARGETALADLAPHGDAAFVSADAADERAVQTSVDFVLDRHGTLDILVNNAGIAVAGGPPSETVRNHDDVTSWCT
jgi:NAD(P)-dependent dehydrogenase (short-subunit alcohol dehydrogenase family)